MAIFMGVVPGVFLKPMQPAVEPHRSQRMAEAEPRAGRVPAPAAGDRGDVGSGAAPAPAQGEAT